MTANLSTGCNRGISSLYVTLIFIVASVIVAGMLEGQELTLTRTSRFIRDEQAMEYAYGAETYARQIVFTETQNRDEDDHLKSWKILNPEFAIPEGTIDVTIEDMGGRFNVNSLLSGDQNAQNYFTQLCLGVGIDPTIPKALFPRFSQKAQTGKSAPGLATQPVWLVDASELVDYGLPVDAYRKLAPYLVAIPAKSYNININAASDVVLRAYGVSDYQISTILETIASKGTVSIDDMGAIQLSNGNLYTRSDAFRATITVRLDGQALRLTSLLYRTASNQAATMNSAPLSSTAGNSAAISATASKKIITIARVWGE